MMKSALFLMVFFLAHVLSAQEADSSILKSDAKPVIDLGAKKKRGLLGRVKGLEKIAALADSAQSIAQDVSDIQKKEQKKQKEPKNTFYGIKTKKLFRKQEEGRALVTEVFYYLPQYEISGFSEDKYYIDLTDKQIKRGDPKEKQLAWIPHGPYERKVDGETVEKGIYFMGSKHGRWETFSKNGYLTSKEKFFKGFPIDSQFSYHDEEKKRLKEVIPYKEGLRDGFYIRLYKSGIIAETGHYKYGVKVGQWVEYYDKKNTANHLRITQHAKDPFDKAFKPFIKKEWNEKGKLTTDNK